MALGSGFRYLMASVAQGDGGPVKGTSLTRYYADSGTPPGVFVGSGVPLLGLAVGEAVTEEHLWRMLGVMAHPVTGIPLGSVPRAGGTSKPVAGFDLTFSPPKSVSTVWALADDATRDAIYRCHRQAIEYVLGYAERGVFHSRSGRGGIVQEDVEGVIACSFTHWDSRAGDPQLHDHVVVWNRARSQSDGQWRTLDSRGLFKAVVALSEMHYGVLSDLLTAELGVGWDALDRRHSERPRWEIAGVSGALLAEFSQRVEQIEEAKDSLVSEFVSATGRRPTMVEILQFRQRATLLTRPVKAHRTLSGMSCDWGNRAAPYVGPDERAWVTSLRNRNDLPLLRATDLSDGILADAAAAITETVAERKSVYSKANLLAEAHRILHGVRFTGPDERVAVAERITNMAVEGSVDLTPEQSCHVPAALRRVDGSSRLRPKGSEMYTTRILIQAEERLLEASRRLDAPGVVSETVAAQLRDPLPGRGYGLSPDQAFAVEQIATSGRRVDVLVGPAGAGKSTAMAGLRAVWEAQHGAGSVIGLAPSAAAAKVLAEELGIDTENTAKWLLEHSRRSERAKRRADLCRQPGATSAYARRKIAAVDREIDRWALQPGQLVIVDEATLAGTFALDRLVSAAQDAGAKVLMVGDPAQLSGVEAGGAFSMLVGDRPTPPTLTDVRRFRHDWEAAASTELRQGRATGVDTYIEHGRVVDGSRAEVLDALHTAWEVDVHAGLSSVMIAADASTVDELNRKARAVRISAGVVAPEGVPIAQGQEAGVGDEVVSRQNDRRIRSGKGWVKNGDRWTIKKSHADGSLTVRPSVSGPDVTLPASYVVDHLELAYAVTTHRVQGRTFDTAHSLVSPVTSREALYVGVSRGRRSNHLYVETSYDPDPTTGHAGALVPTTAREVLETALRNEDASISAHETWERSQMASRSLVRLCAEYQTIASMAQADRWNRLLEECGLSPIETELVMSSPARGALYTALREAEACGRDFAADLKRTIRNGSLVDVLDVASVLHSRIQRLIEAPDAVTANSGWLITPARGVDDPDLLQALLEREAAIQARVTELAFDALRSELPWTRRLGAAPLGEAGRHKWFSTLSQVAGYRERWSIGDDPRPLGPKSVPSIEQQRQRQRVEAAINSAQAMAALQHVAVVGAPGAALQLPAIVTRGPEL